jgi:hypothetical protein
MSRSLRYCAQIIMSTKGRRRESLTGHDNLHPTWSKEESTLLSNAIARLDQVPYLVLSIHKEVFQ